MGEKPICPICGEQTFLVYGKYPRKDGLCKEHSQDLFNKKIELNNEGLFVDVKTGAVLNASAVKEIAEPAKEPKASADELTCIICGKPSNGKHFCLSCYNEYKDHSVDIRITNCREVQIIDRYGNKTIKIG